MSEWAAFWLAVAVYVACECILTMHGIDTFMWQFKTPEEKQLQQKLIQAASKENRP